MGGLNSDILRRVPIYLLYRKNKSWGYGLSCEPGLEAKVKGLNIVLQKVNSMPFLFLVSWVFFQ